MALDVTTKTTEFDLTTTAALKAIVLGASATSTAQDALFSNMIRRASRWADTYVGQPLLAQTYRETVPAFGRRSLMVSRTPVRAINAIYDATDTGTATALGTSEFIVENAEAGLIARDEGFSWTVPFQRRIGNPMWGGDAVPLESTPMPGLEYRPWLIDYVAGYTYDGLSTSSSNWSTAKGSTDTGRTLPDDLEMGVLAKAQGFCDVAEEAESEQLGDLRVNYRSLGTDSNGRVATRANILLEPFRRII